jgi:ribosomal protein S18 acetylase RimI-like enzyme
MPVSVTVAATADLDELAEVAAATFPLACPPSSPPEDIAAFIVANLSRQRFADYLADPTRTVLVAREDDRILGYSILVRGVSENTDVARAVTTRPAVEVSKVYVVADRHGAGVAAALMNAAVRCAADAGARCLWLGVNQENTRAQRFYRKNGFAVAGTKTFQLGAHTEHDFVMVRNL